MDDLVILVPDKNTNFALKGALSRSEAMGIRPIKFSVREHVGRDGGVRTSGAQTLEGEVRRFSHALLVVDFEGSGTSHRTATLLEADLDQQLGRVWGNRAKAIVIDPEVDIWVWGAEQIMRNVLDWPLEEGIREWLAAHGFEFNDHGKPARPKEALERLQPIHKTPRSSSVYQEITSQISLARCSDPSFQRLKAQLGGWFPRTERLAVN